MTRKAASSLAAVVGGFAGGGVMTLAQRWLSLPSLVRITLAGALGAVAALAVQKVLSARCATSEGEDKGSG